MSVVNYFFEKHIERCKKELEDFEKNRFKDVREDLRAETKQYVNGAKTFLDGIDAGGYSNFNQFNGMIKTLNDELNRIMKFSANISSLVYVMPDVSEEDYYTYTDFISYFSYDENKFNNADERDIKQLKRFDKLIEKSDNDLELYKERGDLRAELGLYNEAIDDYKKALELNPNYNEAKQALKRTENDLDIHNFINNNSLIENDSGKDSGYYFDKAYKFYEEGKYKESIVYYSKTIELDPNNSTAYNNRGVAKYCLGQYEEAIKDYDKAIEIDPNYRNAYNNRGLAKKNLGQYKDALKDYKKALELDPNNEYARKNIQIIQNEYGLR